MPDEAAVMEPPQVLPKQTYGQERIRASAEAAKTRRDALADEHAEDLTSVVLILRGLGHAAQIVLMSRASGPVPAEHFARTQARLAAYWHELRCHDTACHSVPGRALRQLLSRWPAVNAGMRFGPYTGYAALHAAYKFVSGVDGALLVARVPICRLDGSYFDEFDLKHPSFEQWRDAAMLELATRAYPLTLMWPTAFQVRTDCESLEYRIRAEWEAHLKCVGAAGAPTEKRWCQASFYDKATKKALNPHLLREAWVDGRIEGQKKDGRRQYELHSVCEKYPQYRHALMQALELIAKSTKEHQPS